MSLIRSRQICKIYPKVLPLYQINAIRQYNAVCGTPTSISGVLQTIIHAKNMHWSRQLWRVLLRVKTVLCESLVNVLFSLKECNLAWNRWPGICSPEKPANTLRPGKMWYALELNWTRDRLFTCLWHAERSTYKLQSHLKSQLTNMMRNRTAVYFIHSFFRPKNRDLCGSQQESLESLVNHDCKWRIAEQQEKWNVHRKFINNRLPKPSVRDRKDLGETENKQGDGCQERRDSLPFMPTNMRWGWWVQLVQEDRKTRDWKRMMIFFHQNKPPELQEEQTEKRTSYYFKPEANAVGGRISGETVKAIKERTFSTQSCINTLC